MAGVPSIFPEWKNGWECSESLPKTVEKRNDKSHIGIVTKVYQDSKGITHFETIEGNTGDAHKVDTRKYTANSRTLSGFISLSKYSA